MRRLIVIMNYVQFDVNHHLIENPFFNFEACGLFEDWVYEHNIIYTDCFRSVVSLVRTYVIGLFRTQSKK